MSLLLELFLIFPLIIIIIQDFKTRTIVWWTIFVFLIASVLIHYKHYKGFSLNEILINLIFFFFQIGGLWIYFSLKMNKIANLTKSYLGIGDILFFIPLSFLFSAVNLVIYFIFSLVLTLIISYFYRYKVKSIFTIPLAGVLSITLMFIRIFNYFNIYDVYDNMILIKMILI